jgi:transposase-like protein
MIDLFKWRHYQSQVILTCVRWYLRYALSYRDLEEMMTEPFVPEWDWTVEPSKLV